MAEKVYEIIITDKTGGERRSTARALNGEQSTQTQKRNQSSSNDMFKTAVADYHYAKRALNVIASYEVSTVELRTGNAKAQQDAELAYQIINDSASILESTIIGSLQGGGAGAAVGMAVGIAIKAANLGVSTAKMNLSQAVESQTIAQNIIRIGSGGNRIGAVK